MSFRQKGRFINVGYYIIIIIMIIIIIITVNNDEPEVLLAVSRPMNQFFSPLRTRDNRHPLYLLIVLVLELKGNRSNVTFVSRKRERNKIAAA